MAHQTLPWPRDDARGQPLGIDLDARGVEVCKIAAKVASQLGLPRGLELDDYQQDVLVAIDARNHTGSAYRPGPTGIGPYVWMIANNRRINWIRDAHRQLRIPSEVLDYERDDEVAELPAEEAEPAPEPTTPVPDRELLARARAALDALGRRTSWGAIARALRAPASSVRQAARGARRLAPEARARLREVLGRGRPLPDGRGRNGRRGLDGAALVALRRDRIRVSGSVADHCPATTPAATTAGG